MLLGKHITVVLPAYNAAKTLRQVYADVPHDIVDTIILVDDHSQENTPAIAHELGIREIIVYMTKTKDMGRTRRAAIERLFNLERIL